MEATVHVVHVPMITVVVNTVAAEEEDAAWAMVAPNETI